MGIEPTTSPLPRECSTTELRQQALRLYHRPRRRMSRPNAVESGAILAIGGMPAQARGAVSECCRAAAGMLGIGPWPQPVRPAKPTSTLSARHGWPRRCVKISSGASNKRGNARWNKKRLRPGLRPKTTRRWQRHPTSAVIRAASKHRWGGCRLYFARGSSANRQVRLTDTV